MDIPAGLAVNCPDPTTINIAGPDKQIVGQFASDVRDNRPPEPYKGKGIYRSGEKVRLKAGKSGKK
jgi:large subunit ribosomal protein L6